MTLEELRRDTENCQRCSLSESRTHVVFGSGSPRAKVMFVGEAPGYYEDQEGIPFVGAAGKLLTQLLGEIGIRREDVYIGNVLKCRPPQNRDPLPEEVASCKPYLLKQIEIIEPRVICTLGNFATQAISEKKTSISRVRGTCFQVGDFFVFPMYHPAAALHRGSTMPAIKEDFAKLKTLLEKDVQPQKRPEQLDLF